MATSTAKPTKRVTIRPYYDEGAVNMGLEKYQTPLFDYTQHTYEIAAIQEGNNIRFLTGLNPYAPELTRLRETDKEAYEAKVKEIKSIVIEVERQLGGNVIDEAEENWWNKVERLKPDNTKFWASNRMRIELNNDPKFLEPTKEVTDLLKYYAIKAGGVPEIAKNFEEARSAIRPPKFYLDELEETASVKTEVSKIRNKAGAELQKLFDKNVNKLFYVMKVIDPNSPQYKKSTPLDIMYENADKYINGETVERDKRKTAQHFIEVCELDMETLKIRAIVKDASFYRLIAQRGDGVTYELASSTALGKNPSQIAEFLKNPLNEEILMRLTKEVEYQWKQ